MKVLVPLVLLALCVACTSSTGGTAPPEDLGDSGESRSGSLCEGVECPEEQVCRTGDGKCATDWWGAGPCKNLWNIEGWWSGPYVSGDWMVVMLTERESSCTVHLHKASYLHASFSEVRDFPLTATEGNRRVVVHDATTLENGCREILIETYRKTGDCESCWEPDLFYSFRRWDTADENAILYGLHCW